MDRQLAFLLVALTLPAAAEETVTDDLLTGTWTVNGSVIDHTYPGGYLNGHVHTDFQGGSISQTIDLSAYQGQQEYNYFTQVSACENQIGGHCGSGTLDTFTVTLTLDTGETWTDTFLVGQQWQDIDITYTPSADALSATLDLYGIDNGYWGGWYGPVYYAGEFTVKYDPTLVAVILPAAEDPTLQTTALNDVFTPTVEIPAVEVEIPTVQVETPTVTPQTQEVSGATEMAAETPAEQPAAEAQQESQESTESPAGGGTGGSEPKQESPKSSGQTKLADLVVTLDVANADMSAIQDVAGDPASPVAQALALAVMASQGVQLEDTKLSEPQLPKGPVLKDNRNLADRFWMGMMADDARFDRYMVEAQWQI